MTKAEQFECEVREHAEVVTISAAARITAAARAMRGHKVGCLVVVDDRDEMVGIVSERDILDWVSKSSPETFTARVADIMASNVIFCTPQTPMEEAEELMAQYGIRHLPVVDGGRPVGMISSRDVMSHQLRAREAE